MSSRVRALKLAFMAAGLAGLLPALSSAQGFNLHRKAGMWDSTMMVAGRAMTSSMCTDEAFEKKFSAISPQQMGARDCSNMVPVPIPGGYRAEGTCSSGGRTSHITATVKGDFNTAYAMDLVTEVNGKPQPPVHMDVKWTGPCGAGVKPGDMVMTTPDGRRMVVNVAAMAGAAGGRPGAGGR